MPKTTVQIPLRIDPELLAQIEAIINETHESRQGFIVRAIREKLGLVCNIDDGATICVLPLGHAGPHCSKDGRSFIF